MYSCCNLSAGLLILQLESYSHVFGTLLCLCYREGPEGGGGVV